MSRSRRFLHGVIGAAICASTTVALAPPALAETAPPLDLEYSYSAQTPPEARKAMDVVEDLLDDVLASSVPVRVKIEWEVGGDPNTLASAGAEAHPFNFPNAPKRDVEYPVALANALAGTDLTPGDFHISSTINGDIDWDFSVGTTHRDKLDFIGTMIHEVLHGLGFAGNGSCDGQTCWITGGSNLPVIFDTFLVDGNGKPMTSYADGSPELRAAMTSDAVSWNGPLGVAAARSAESGTTNCGDNQVSACPRAPKIHAPKTFEPGSSMSHWDEVTYPAANPNAMMTAAGANGETAQSIGPMTRAVLREMGWPTSDNPAPKPPGKAFDGNPATTERVDVATPTAAAIKMSQASFAADGAQVATISRSDKFADALAASALGAYGPLLFTSKDRLEPAVRAEVDRALAPGATVYIVGGPGAVSKAVEDELLAAGYKVTRLQGPNRFATAVRITQEVFRLNPNATTLLFARGYGTAADPEGSAAWADSISAAAYAAATRNPLLLVRTEAVPQEVLDYLSSPDGAPLSNLRWVVLGGPGAVSQQVFDRLGADVRVSGTSRETTSIAIANELFGVDGTGRRNYAIVHGRNGLGWGWGLAVSGAAGRAGAPILLVTDQVAPEVRAEVRGCEAYQVDLLVSGPRTVVSASVQNQLDSVDNAAC